MWGDSVQTFSEHEPSGAHPDKPWVKSVLCIIFTACSIFCNRKVNSLKARHSLIRKKAHKNLGIK